MSLWLIWVVSLAITTPRERPFLIVLLAIIGGVVLLGYWARKNPEASWVYWLWDWEIGPRTNAPTMSRYDLVRSGVRFLFCAVVLFGLLIGIFQFGLQPGQESVLMLVLLFVLSIGFLMCAAAGLYLLIRRALKKGL